MATNLLISAYGIPQRSQLYAGGSTPDTYFEQANATVGGRGIFFRPSSEGTSSELRFDIGTGDLPHAGQPDHLIITRADLMVKKDSASTTYRLDGSTVSDFTSNEQETLTVNAAGLVGPNSEDAVNASMSFSTIYRFWRIVTSTTVTMFQQYGNAYFGNWIDLGREPSYGASLARAPGNGKYRKPRWVVTFTWQGISDANRQEFIQKALRYKDIAPVFLYDTNDYIFGGHTLIHCWIRQASVSTIQPNVNTITATFEEII